MSCYYSFDESETADKIKRYKFTIQTWFTYLTIDLNITIFKLNA